VVSAKSNFIPLTQEHEHRTSFKIAARGAENSLGESNAMINLQKRFICRSAEYNYASLQCHLSDTDRRTAGTGPLSQLVDSPGVDYFENLCLNGKNDFLLPNLFIFF